MAGQPPEDSKKYFAMIPRKVVIARITTEPRIENRIWWAVVLMSWCGPGMSDLCVKKDSGGYVLKDARGIPTPATQADIRRLLGMREERRGHISRAFDNLRAEGSIWVDAENNFGPIDNPSVRTSDEAAGIRNSKFKLPGLTIELPTDPERQQQALGELRPIRIGYNSGLKQLRHETREKAKPVIERLGLQPVQKSTPAPAASSCADPVTSTRTSDVTSTGSQTADIGNRAIGTAPGMSNFELPVLGTFDPAIKEEILERRESKAEEEEGAPTAALDKPLPRYHDFRSLYPAQRLDDAKARIAFNELPSFEKSFCFEGLLNHITCERWVRSLNENGGQYIPLASNFINDRHYAGDPPPYIGPQLSPAERREKTRLEQLAADAREIFERNMRRKQRNELP